MSDRRLNGAPTLRIGFMHVLSIVEMLYLSSKSLSVHKHGDEDYSSRRTCLAARWIIAY